MGGTHRINDMQDTVLEQRISLDDPGAVDVLHVVAVLVRFDRHGHPGAGERLKGPPVLQERCVRQCVDENVRLDEVGQLRRGQFLTELETLIARRKDGDLGLLVERLQELIAGRRRVA